MAIEIREGLQLRPFMRPFRVLTSFFFQMWVVDHLEMGIGQPRQGSIPCEIPLGVQTDGVMESLSTLSLWVIITPNLAPDQILF